MTFNDLMSGVLASTLACGRNEKSRNLVVENDAKSRWIIAAATIVVSERGLDACSMDLDDFIEWTVGRLGFWVSIALFFIGGTGLMWALARIILPILVDWINEQRLIGFCGTSFGDPVLAAVAGEARVFLDKEELVASCERTGKNM